jgi:hypothetical protein
VRKRNTPSPATPHKSLSLEEILKGKPDKDNKKEIPLIEIILEKLKKEDNPDFNKKVDQQNNTIFHLIASNPNQLELLKETVVLAYEKGFDLDLNQYNSLHQTPLDIARGDDREWNEMAKLLLENGAIRDEVKVINQMLTSNENNVLITRAIDNLKHPPLSDFERESIMQKAGDEGRNDIAQKLKNPDTKPKPKTADELSQNQKDIITIS